MLTSKVFSVIGLLCILSLLGCGSSAKQNEAFAKEIQGRWKGGRLELEIGKNSVTMSEGSQSDTVRYKLFPADRRIEITNPENGAVLKGSLKDPDTLEIETTKRPGKTLTMHRMPGENDE